MDKNDSGKPQIKVKKSLINSLLAKRSTKVEPHPSSFDDNNVSGQSYRPFTSSGHSEATQSVSANSSPMKMCRSGGSGGVGGGIVGSNNDDKTDKNQMWRRHNSSHNMNSIDSVTSSSYMRPTANATNAASKIPLATKNANNRLSHPFSLCCNSFDVNSVTPPTTATGAYDVFENQENVGKPTDCDTTSNGHYKVVSTRVDVHPPIRTPTPPSNSSLDHGNLSPTRLPNAMKSDESNGSIVGGNDSTPTSPPTEGSTASAKPVFAEYQTKSIAMSACRSRFREKLLPPGTILNATPEQHLSSPNISDKSMEKSIVTAHRNSRSYSYDVLVGKSGVDRPGSTDSLVKQSLMAAQVLHLIPTEKARERSYLANNLAVNSLLGPAELDRVLPAREIKIFVGTWNMNGQHPPKQMNDFVLPTGVEHVPDVVVMGTQESCPERFEWEVILQETLGPSHVLLHSTTLGTLHLAAYIRRDLIWFCSMPEDDSLSVRPGTAFRTKGAVAISFCLFGTSMLFVTSHLTAHQQKVKERVSDVKRIIHSLDLPKNLNIRSKNKDVTQNFDLVFWCGDLNFRLGEPREKLLKWIETTKFPLPSHLPHGYMHTDQLKSILANGAAFKDFKEANITFPPTYKYDPGTQQFDTSSKQRAPAYTDRILFKSKSMPLGLRRGSNLVSFLGGGALECIAYDSVPSIVTSDHKPVWGLFKSCIRPGIDSIPLAAGLFNREVYLEGMKRRLKNKQAGNSAVCCIQ